MPETPPATAAGADALESPSAPAPLDRLLAQTRRAVADDSFVRLLLTAAPSAPSAPSTPEAPRRLSVRLILLHGSAQLSLTRQYARRDETVNLPVEDALAALRAELTTGGYRGALLGTTTRDWQLTTDPSGATRLVAHRPTTTAAPPRTHDEPVRRVLDPHAPFLHALGLADTHGRVPARQQAKFRQVAHYAALLDPVVDDLGWRPGQPRRTVVDMGCGRGLLTFGLWHLLREVRGLEVTVTGIERRPELVDAANAAARSAGCRGLVFRAGEIAAIPLEGVHAVVALHACNTATDEALRRGIEAGAELLLAAPCCHQEFRPQIERDRDRSGLLEPLLRHGLLRERFAEWLTDGLRALTLEWAGYDTRVVEFVASEHTPKNLLLVAVKRQRPAPPSRLRETIQNLKAHFGLGDLALDPILGPRPTA